MPPRAAGTLDLVRSIDVKHRMGETDIAAIGDLLDAAAGVDGRRPLSDHLHLDLVNGGSPGFAALMVTEPGRAQPVAYGQLSAGNDVRLLELVVDPAHRAQLAEIATELLAAARQVVASDGGGTIVWWVSEPSDAELALASRAGMREQRRLLQMRRPLPTGMAVEIPTRAFRPGDDDEEWLRVNNRAFAEHHEQGGWTSETLRTRQAEPWFDADGFRIHERDGRMAGFCWTKIHSAELDHDPLGEIYVIAVDPDFHGLGLGRQLTLAGLDSLAERGIRHGMLFVDADNRTAVPMYERLGFVVHATDVAFEVDVPASAPDERDTHREGTQP
jgi:mycothiol synthase